jgi:hypothetical protein
MCLSQQQCGQEGVMLPPAACTAGCLTGGGTKVEVCLVIILAVCCCHRSQSCRPQQWLPVLAVDDETACVALPA